MGSSAIIGASREETISDLEQNIRDSGYEILDRSKKSGVIYHAVQKGEKSFVLVTTIRKQGSDYWTKNMGEDMGPCYFDCPIRLLEMTKGFANSYSVNWRNAVRDYHKKRSVKFNIGDRVSCYGQNYTIVGKIKRSYAVRCDETGTVYKSSSQKLTHLKEES
jgi:hypothetical protein